MQNQRSLTVTFYAVDIECRKAFILPPENNDVESVVWNVFEGNNSCVRVSLCFQNFLLSASMDKTVQLWHASTGDCLRKLEHSDYGEMAVRDQCLQFILPPFLVSTSSSNTTKRSALHLILSLWMLVTRVAFNPLNVKIFVSACLDQKVRLWNATNATMVAHADCKELLTACAFKSDGLVSLAHSR